MDSGVLLLGGLLCLGIAGSKSSSTNSTTTTTTTTVETLTVTSIDLPDGNGIDAHGNMTVNTLTLTGSGATVSAMKAQVKEDASNATLTVSGVTDLDVLEVNGAASLKDGLTVSGLSTLELLTATGVTNLKSSLTVTGNTSLGAALSVAGASTLGSLSVTGTASIASTLAVTGASTLGALSVTSFSMPLGGASSGAVLTADSSGKGTWQAASGGGASSSLNPVYFGTTTGTIGGVASSPSTDTLVISASLHGNSPYILTGDEYHYNTTIAADGILYTNGWRLFVSGTLDISQAKSGSIAVASLNNIGQGISGTDAVNGTKGLQGQNIQPGTLGGSILSTLYDGQPGITTAGTNGVASAFGTDPNPFPYQFGGLGHPGGAGGNAGSFSGKSNGSSSTNTATLRFFSYTREFWAGGMLIYGGGVGYGGGSGAVDSGSLNITSGAGGGGGAGGGILWIAANNIVKSSSTQAGVIAAVGGNGGKGGDAAFTSGTTGSAGGGGGGSGGGGGFVYLVYNTATGPTISGLISVAGGIAGAGGAGIGAGTSGQTGTNGDNGRATIINLSTSTIIDTAVDPNSRLTPPATIDF